MDESDSIPPAAIVRAILLENAAVLVNAGMPFRHKRTQIIIAQFHFLSKEIAAIYTTFFLGIFYAYLFEVMNYFSPTFDLCTYLLN